MQIRPIMTNLPKLVDTYDAVTGSVNPFTNISGVDQYGADAMAYNDYMHLFYGEIPVMNDRTRLTLQIAMVFAENGAKYAAMYAAQTAAAVLDPKTEMHYTDTNARTGNDHLNKTGTETNTRTGNVADSGTDSTTDTSTITDSTVTYDNSTLRDTAKSTHGGGVSVTHGKTTTYNSVADARTFTGRTDETVYNSTFTRTISGYKTAPAKIMEQYTEFVKNNNVFAEIIRDVVKSISCVVYIPVIPAENEEE